MGDHHLVPVIVDCNTLRSKLLVCNSLPIEQEALKAPDFGLGIVSKKMFLSLQYRTFGGCLLWNSAPNEKAVVLPGLLIKVSESAASECSFWPRHWSILLHASGVERF